MRRVKGKRYDTERKLNVKKVIAFVIAIIVLVMVFVSLKHLFSNGNDVLTKDVSTLTTYISVYENDKWGVIDNKGNKIIEPTYDEMIIIPNKNEAVFVCTYDVDYTTGEYKTKILDEKNKEILDGYTLIEAIENSNLNEVWYEKAVLRFEKDGKFGLVDYSEKVVLDAEYDSIVAMPGIENNLIIEKEGLFGVYNILTNEIVIEPKYVEVKTLNDDYSNGYIVKNDQNLYGLIAADKKQVLDFKYTEIKSISSNNMYAVVENDKEILVDNTDKTIIDSGYESIEEIHTSDIVIKKDGKFGLITTLNEEKLKAEYDYLKYAFDNYYIAGKDGKKGIIDIESNVKVAFEYQTITYVEEANLFVADKNETSTDIINSNLEVAISNVIISELNTEYGYLRVRDGENYKYYNFKLEEKTNIEMLATNTLFLIKENGKYGYVNKNGDKVVNAKYDDAMEQNKFGYCAVKKDGLWGVLKSDGTVLLEPSVNLDDYLVIDFISEYHRYNDVKLNAYTK